MTQFGRFAYTLAAGASSLALSPSALAQQAEQPVAATAPTAQAQSENNGDAGDIIVTARKREERLQDVPMSISAISGKTLDTERLFRIQDFSAKVPNFVAVQQNTRVSGLYLRGLGGNGNSDGAEAGVGLIVDNVFLTYPGFSWLDFIDLDHIEVARGPQGTLLGKNTTIGALIVTTKKPSFDPELDLEATSGNRHFYSIHANATGPIIGDKLAYRVTFYDDKGDGWVNNVYNGQKLLDNNRWAVRGQLLYVDGNVTDRLIAEHHESNEYNNAYIPFTDVNTLVSGAPRVGWQSKLGTLFGYTPTYSSTNSVDADSEGLVHTQTNGVSNELNWQIGDHTLTSVTAWRELKYRPDHDGDLSPFPILKAGYDVDVDQYSEELRLASPTGRVFEYQVGAYFLRENVASNNRTQFQGASTAYFLSPLLPSIVTNGLEYDQLGKEQVTSGAVFGQATWHVTDRASLTGGLRFTRENKQVSNVSSAFGGAPLPPSLQPYQTALVNGFGGLFSLEGSNTFNSVSWLVNPSYKLGDHVLAYATVSYGAKSGAANLAATPGKPLIIKPEKSTDYEVGLKTTLAGGRVTLNGDLYWNDITDYQAAQLDPARIALGTYLGNAGHVRLRGVELEGSAKISAHLSVSLSGAYNDAKYISYVNAPAPVEYGGGTLDLSGLTLAGSAKWNGQASVNYDAPISSHLNIFAYANEAYRSGSNLLNPLSIYGWQPGYALTNSGIGLRGADDRWSIELWGRNVFDKRYAVGIQAASPVAPFFKIPGDPRTFGITLKGKF